MNRGSLKLRLMVASGLGISLSLIVAGFSFYLIFQRYIEREVLKELDAEFVQLVSYLRVDETNTIRITNNLSDPRFQKPYGGLYWQVNESDKAVARSRSLFDFMLPTRNFAPSIADYNVHLIAGPSQSKLFAIDKMVELPVEGASARSLNIMLAADRREVDDTVKSFSRDLAIGLGLLYVALLGGALMQIALGLRPLEDLRVKAETVRQGGAQHLEGDFPYEVRPVVEEMNALLTERHDQLERARMRASDMAHGLKTPLTVMRAIADSIAANGLSQQADEIRDGADQMYDVVERELARARLATGHAVQLTEVKPVIDRMVTALSKTAENRELLWHVEVPREARLAIEARDLLELVGNLLDNARKFARSRVDVAFAEGVLSIDDDGPGVPEAQIGLIQERGVRLDETVAGSGLGLGIVRDIAEVYGLTVVFARSKLGGLRVMVRDISRKRKVGRQSA